MSLLPDQIDIGSIEVIVRSSLNLLYIRVSPHFDITDLIINE